MTPNTVYCSLYLPFIKSFSQMNFFTPCPPPPPVPPVLLPHHWPNAVGSQPSAPTNSVSRSLTAL